MYRYDSGKLVPVDVKVDGTQDYVAISHVWGAGAKWLRIPGPGPDGQLEIKASKEKAKFITETLPKEIGDGNIFWMDILCIDQTDEAAKIAVTQNIPDIFRFAASTLVVRESSGFQDCCLKALSDDLLDLEENRRALAAHHGAVHKGKWFSEGILTRLWPLQEALLSDRLRFVQCNAVEENVAEEGKNMSALDARNLFQILWHFAHQWAVQDIGRGKSGDARGDFMRAYLSCGEVSRKGASGPPTPVPSQEYLVLHMNSPRKTTKPRDFILAIMPQYEFYRVPPKAKQMTFGQLFLDCYQQMEAARSDQQVTPLFMDDISARCPKFTATDEIPEPICLGDLMKLFLGTRPRLCETLGVEYPLGKMRLFPAQVKLPREFLTRDNYRSALLLIIQAMRESRMTWSFALDELQDNDRDSHREVMSRQQHPSGEDPQFTKFVAMKVFAFLKINAYHDNTSTPAEVVENLYRIEGFDTILRGVSPYYLVLLAAMISCGLGVSANDVGVSGIEWARHNLAPLLVTFRDRSCLGLARGDIAFQAGLEYFMVQTETSLWFNITPSRLLARHPAVPDTYHVCLFPNLSNFS